MVKDFLENFKNKAALWISGDNLRFRASKKTVSKEDVEKLKLYKEEIVKLLRKGDYVSQTAPLSRGQEALYFLQRLNPEGSAYNIGLALRVLSPLDREITRKAAQALVERHPALRTLFHDGEDGKPLQNIYGYKEAFFEEIDASGWSPEELKKQAQKKYELPFDPEKGPLFKTRLFVVSPEESLLLLSFHHIIVDAWSLWTILGELLKFYAAQSSGIQADFEPLQGSCLDFVAGQSEKLAGPEGDKLWEYWRKKLSGDLSPLNLPTDYPRPPRQTFNGSTYIFTLTPELTEQLKALAKSEGTTLFVLLLAAYQILLFRCSGQDDIMVSSPTSGRLNPKLRQVVGNFMNFVVMRADFSQDIGFRDHLAKTAATVLEALKHQEYPFVDLVEKLWTKRGSNFPPLTQTEFILQNPQNARVTRLISGERVNWGHLEIEGAEISQSGGQQDMQLEMMETKDHLFGDFKYNTDLFSRSSIRRMAERFRGVLEAIVKNPDQKVSRTPIISEEENRLLAEWNDTKKDYPKGKLIYQLFEEQAEKTPDAPALIYEDKSLTYAELNAKTNQLARYLQFSGVGPETLVGVCMERSLDMVVSLMAVLKAGGAYTPLDPTYPKERLAYMLNDAEAPVLLTQSALVEGLPDHRAKVICPDVDQRIIAGASEKNLPVLVDGDNAAYMIYTSGSTGKPKGTVNTHKGIYNRLLWMQDAYPLTAEDRVLQKTPFTFDVSVWEFFWPLMFGARLVVARPEGHKDGAYLRNLIAGRKITTLHFVPSMLSVFLETEGIETLSDLKRVICSGEALSFDLQKRFFAVLGNVELHNLYGPTEAAVDVTFLQCQKNADRQIVPIGRPIANTQIHILDASLNPVPIGVSGELHIGGAGLARGYLNRPELTREKFIPNPFDDDPDSRLYKSGDLARHLPDGNIEFLGRLDYQIKIRGLRIELGEIESVLAGHDAVREVAVMVAEGRADDKRLVAYITADPALDDDETRAFLGNKLPDYMIPSAFVFLETMPLSLNGKIDRKALAVMDVDLIRKTEFVAPRGATEKTLARIWSELLGVEKVGALDNFFELGGHSLLAAQVVARTQKAFGVEMSLQNFFTVPVLAKAAAFIDSSHVSDKDGPPPIEPVSEKSGAPLSFAQQRLWFLDQLETSASTYNIPAAVKISGALSVRALERSINEIAKRHESLRSNFANINGEASLVVRPSARVKLELINPRSPDEADREKETKLLIEREAKKPFDLANDPLIRVVLLTLDKNSHVLILTTHHIISDGWSVGVFLNELSILYRALREAEETGVEPDVSSLLPELKIQCSDFAFWQRQWLRGEVLESQSRYWKNQLADAPVLLEMPTDRSRPATRASDGDVFRFKLDADLTAGLSALSHEKNVTMFMLLESALAVLLSRHANQDDILIGIPIANRTRPEIEPLIGFFVNTLVMRNDLRDDPQFSDLLEKTRRTALEAYAHQDIPFEKVVDVLGLERRLSHSPLFQVMFAWQNVVEAGVDLPGLTMKRLEIDSGSAKFDLTLFMEEGEEIRGGWEYSSDLFDRDTIERLSERFRILLKGIVSDPERKISRLPILEESEERLLLVEWNGPETDYPKDKRVHQLFEEQTLKTPDNIAAVFENQSLTYAELNAKANQLARHLRTLGVGPDVLVGICAERSLEMVVGILGALKAGGAYVPLDPTYPKERLAYMLSDSKASILLTRSSLSDILSEYRGTTVRLDADWETIAKESGENIAGEVKPENLAYVIYTSGSTGEPKGTEIAHQGLCNVITEQIKTFKLTQESRVLQFASFSFDAAVSEIFIALCSGAAICLAKKEDLLPGPGLSLLLRDLKITMFTLPPSALANLPFEDFPDLKTVTVAGEACHPELAARWAADGRLFLNLYGPTEATIWATAAECDGSEDKITIGRSIANTNVYILNDKLRLAPIGVSGELHISGPGLARGYLGRPGMTGEKFISNPFDDDPDSRLYKTGDLARRLPNGDIEFLGRMDHQVKIRGFRIELSEIEANLLKHPRIKEAAVIASEDRPGDKRLTAYLSPDSEDAGRALSYDDARGFLKNRLPDYMIPSAFVFPESMPLTPNGKIDRAALAALNVDLIRENEFVAPESETEKTLARIWSELLGVEKVGALDNFFELGGHSLMAVNLVSKIQERTGKQLSVAGIFERPSIRQLGELLDKNNGEFVFTPLVRLESRKTAPNERPVFFAHAADGSLFHYADLAKALGELETRRPFYGLRAYGLEAGTLPLNSVEEMAAKYLAAARSVRNNGPLAVVGFSMGGVTAYEMAARLESAGEKIECLALIDTMQFRELSSLGFGEAESFFIFIAELAGTRKVDPLSFYCDLRGIDLDKGTPEIFSDVERLSEAERLSALWRIAQKADILPDGIEEEYLSRVYRVYRNNIRAMKTYAPKPYGGRLVLMKAARSQKFFDNDRSYLALVPEVNEKLKALATARTQNPTLGWDEYCGDIEVHEIPGDHFSMLRPPNVKVLAEKLKSILD